MNLEQEIKTWSDGVLKTLAYEEELSDDFRILVLKELDLRPDSMVTLTSDMLHSAGTGGMGWNHKQLQALGVKNKAKGWLKRLVGTEVTQDQWRKFVSLKNQKRAGPSLSYSPQVLPPS